MISKNIKIYFIKNKLQCKKKYIKKILKYIFYKKNKIFYYLKIKISI